MHWGEENPYLPTLEGVLKLLLWEYTHLWKLYYLCIFPTVTRSDIKTKKSDLEERREGREKGREGEEGKEKKGWKLTVVWLCFLEHAYFSHRLFPKCLSVKLPPSLASLSVSGGTKESALTLAAGNASVRQLVRQCLSKLPKVLTCFK